MWVMAGWRLLWGSFGGYVRPPGIVCAAHHRQSLPIPSQPAPMATAQGTRAFLARHAARHHPALLPRSIADFAVSSLGMGCYRIDASIPDTTEALQEAVRRGVNVLDTSSNYQQEPVGQALQGLLSRGDVQREEVMVMTKVGSIQRDGMEEARLREAEGKVELHPCFVEPKGLGPAPAPPCPPLVPSPSAGLADDHRRSNGDAPRL